MKRTTWPYKPEGFLWGSRSGLSCAPSSLPSIDVLGPLLLQTKLLPPPPLPPPLPDISAFPLAADSVRLPAQQLPSQAGPIKPHSSNCFWWLFSELPPTCLQIGSKFRPKLQILELGVSPHSSQPGVCLSGCVFNLGGGYLLIPLPLFVSPLLP